MLYIEHTEAGDNSIFRLPLERESAAARLTATDHGGCP